MATITGTPGNDRLSATGNSGVDDVFGLGGNDVIFAARPNNGGAGTVNLYGGDGDDQLFGVDQFDYEFANFTPATTNMYGGAGNDLITLFRLRSVTIEGGEGVDTLVHYVGFPSRGVPAGFTLGLTVDLAAGTWTNGTISGIEHVTGNISTRDTLLGDEADNILLAGGFDTRLGAGGETVSGRGGNDTLSTGNGDDVLDGGSGIDTMTGGVGNDIYVVDDSRDVVVEQQNQGTDEVRATGSFVELYAGVENLTNIGTGSFTGWGNNFDNIMTGGTGSDALYGFAGADTLLGGAGDDALYGGVGNDRLDGGTGADSLAGGVGDDVYNVDSPGDDVVEFAGEGIDTAYFSSDHMLISNSELELAILTGAAARFTASNTANQVVGNALDNVISGLGGDDDLQGGAGRDQLFGGDGADLIDGGTGADTLDGGAGDDVIVVDDAADVVIEAAGGGYDRLFLSTSFDLARTAEVEAVILAVSGLRVTGSDTDNLIVNAGEVSTIFGLGGDDYLLGGSGTDNLYGGDGRDRLEGGAGVDNLQGGAGDDLYIVDQSGEELIEFAGQGSDTGYFSADFQLISNVELELAIMQGEARQFFASNTANQVVGNALNNEIFGFGGDDTLRGGAGSDRLNGGDGNDLLDGEAGADIMAGGDGDDIYVVDSSTDQIEEGQGRGSDRLFVSTDFRLTAEANIETIVLTAANTVLIGNDQANLIVTAATGNIMDGRGGADEIRGGAGDERLIGGGGRDSLFGGAGADQFLLDVPTGTSADRIEDFLVGTDRITLNGAEYGLAPGPLDPSRFRLETASGSQAQFVYQTENRTLFWDADGNGAGAAVEVASFAAPTALSAADFFVLG